MCFKIILKVAKKQGFTLSIKDTFFAKRQGDQFNPSPLPERLGFSNIKITKYFNYEPRFNDFFQEIIYLD